MTGPDGFVTEAIGDVITSHLGGVAWHAAPVPPKRHECRVQTDGWIGFRQYQRCACGAIRGNIRPEWFDRNSRRLR